MTRRRACIRKPRPPHRARRVHGPRRFRRQRTSLSLLISFLTTQRRRMAPLFPTARASSSALLPGPGSAFWPRWQLRFTHRVGLPLEPISQFWCPRPSATRTTSLKTCLCLALAEVGVGPAPQNLELPSHLYRFSCQESLKTAMPRDSWASPPALQQK